MDTLFCPYCQCKVPIKEVDDEGGECPECGAIITGSHLMQQRREREALQEYDQENIDAAINKDPDEDIDLKT